MVSYGCVKGYLLKSEKFCPKVADKNLVSVTNNGLGNPMQLENLLKVDLSHLSCCDRVRKSQTMGILAKSINNDQNSILASRLRKSLHKIQSGIYPNCV